MDIQLIADSCCDTTPALREKLDLRLVPLKITVDGVHYTDDLDLDKDALLAAIKATRHPIATSAPSPEEYAWCMRGDAPAVVITLSSKLSGSYNAAMAARQMVLEDHPDKQIAVYDSKCASAGMLRIILRADSLIQSGATFEQLTEALPHFIDDVRTLFVLDDLSVLVKNGRIPKMKGMLAALILLRPIMGENGDGEIIELERVRGSAKALDRLVGMLAERTEERPPKSVLVTLSYCERPERAAHLKVQLLERCPAIRKVVLAPTSGLSSTYANEGGIVLAYA